MARGRDLYRQAQIERKRALQEEKTSLYAQMNYIKSEIDRLYDLINSADRSDYHMRQAIKGWRSEIDGLKAERSELKYNIETMNMEMAEINSWLGRY